MTVKRLESRPVISFLAAVVANTIRAKQYPLSRNILVSGSVGSAAALLLIVVFSAYAIGGDAAFFEAHLFGRTVPWWLGILVVMAAFFAIFALSAALGHVVNAKLGDS